MARIILMSKFHAQYTLNSQKQWAYELPVLLWNELSLLPSDMCFFFSILSFIHCHNLSRMRMLPSIHCVNIIQFREMFAAAAKSHCYTLRHPIWEKPPNRLYNHSVQDKSCLVLIPRSSCSQNTTTMHFIADEPVSCGRENEPTKIFIHENDVYSTGLSLASYRKEPLRLY